MNEFKAYKFWIGDDPELSEKVQLILFDAGYGWPDSINIVSNTHGYALFVDRVGRLSWNGDNTTYFNSVISGEINIDWMRTKKPETIELGGKKYIKSELEEALSHIKPVE